MERAWGEPVDKWASTTKPWQIGQKSKLNNCLKCLYQPEVKAAEFDEIFTFIGDKKTESISLRL